MWFGFRDLNWEFFASTVLLFPRAISSATCKLMSTPHAGVRPKKGQYQLFLYTLTAKLTVWTKVTDRMLIRGLFCSFSLFRDQNNSEVHIGGLKWNLNCEDLFMIILKI
jgi:hypothetical protein